MTDGDDDGLIDTVASMPDALATTANYLRSLGWNDAMPWGIEVTAPDAVARTMSSSQGEHACLATSPTAGRCRRLAEWDALGVKRVDGRPLLSALDEWPGLGIASGDCAADPVRSQGTGMARHLRTSRRSGTTTGPMPMPLPSGFSPRRFAASLA